MTITRGARERVDRCTQQAIAQIKDEYRDRIRRIQQAFLPPLSNFELSVGLGLRAAEGGGSDVARYVSRSPRLRRSRPNTATRALLDALAAGEVLLAVQRDAVPGAARGLVVCDEVEAARLGAGWELRNLGGGPVPERQATYLAEDWEEDDLWDLSADQAQGGANPAAAGAGPLRFLGDLDLPPVGLGCMRLSTPGRPERGAALDVIRAALDAGTRLLDTADTYGLDEGDLHHNHRLIREALDSWDGPANEVVVATKIGMARKGRRYVPRGRPEQLLDAARQSREALGQGALDLLQLHVVDPAVPFGEVLDALGQLQRQGVARRLGLCNVDRAQVEQALETLDLVSVQNACSTYQPGDLQQGLVAWLGRRGVAYLPHSPLGGHRRRRGTTAAAAGDGPPAEQRHLAWLLSMAPNVLPLPGATRRASARGSSGGEVGSSLPAAPAPAGRADLGVHTLSA